MSRFIVRKIKLFILTIVVVLLLFSCSSPGAPQDAPVPRRSIYSQPQQPAQAAPGYYYQQQPNQQQMYYPPRYNTYPQQTAPASRYYSNPYDFPPQNAYPYYDGDQYYSRPYGTEVNDNYMPGSSNDMKY